MLRRVVCDFLRFNTEFFSSIFELGMPNEVFNFISK